MVRALGVLALCWGGVLFGVGPAYAQLDLPGAGSGSFSVITGANSITFDATESKLGVNWANTSRNTARQDCNTLPPADQMPCMQKNSLKSKWFAQVNGAVAAQKGKRTLFSKGDLTPGFDAGFVFGRDFEHKSGVTSPYVGTVVGTRGIPTLDTVAGIPARQELVTKTEKAIGILFGLNHYFREDFVIGGVYRGSWNYSTPANQRLRQVCQVRNTGTTANGSTIVSQDCSDRYPGPLTDDYLQQYRLDVLKTFGRVDKESWGIVGGVSSEKRTDNSTTFNGAVGPVLHPKGRPYQTLLAVLVTFTDFTDASKAGKDFTDVFGVSLRIGIPLTGF